MFTKIYTWLFGDANAKKIKHYASLVEKIKTIESRFETEIQTIDHVQQKTRSFMAKFAGIDVLSEEGSVQAKAILESIKLEAFALHRRACRLIFGQEFELPGGKKYTWNMIPFDVQLIGAYALHDSSIAEMKTGEGKTLVATLAAYLNALAGIPVHVVTVNDYLAQRDAAEMGIIYKTLGLTVGCVIHSQSPDIKKQQYNANVVYITNNELGFDYLRDNMATAQERRVLGPLFYAIVDEVDSILVDEARTPLIISSPDAEPTTKYLKFAEIAKKLDLEKQHYKIDEKMKTATLTEEGIREIEKILGVENIYVSDHYNDIHHIENALKARTVFTRDIDYLVRNDEVLIIDEHTGRVLSGRRYSDGLHQALEAKERVSIQQESRTLASITFQNLFRLYRKLSGMTGTAKTEEEEFYKIYHLEVVEVPTNMPMIRIDKSDLLFKNEKGKFGYIVTLIKKLHEAGQPVLVGTVSVAKSEYLSALLEKEGVPHQVLNAKQDAREADVIAQAGRHGAVTIATNMAGRGTDIKIDETVRTLAGTIEIAGQTYPLGGLYVIGTEKHETRRIDNQLRGRSGRQGDPGLSQFMVSPQDDIMRIFGGDKLFRIFNSAMFASLPDHEPLVESGMLTKRITTVQTQVEGHNFDLRKHVLEYDDVLNYHRLVIYSRRNKILDNQDIHEEILKMVARYAEKLSDSVGEDQYLMWDREKFVQQVNDFVGSALVSDAFLDDATTKEELSKKLEEALVVAIDGVRAKVDAERFLEFEKQLTLRSIDELWMNHIDAMAHLREEVAFEGYAQKQPLVVYKERAYEKFIRLLDEIEFKVVKGLLTASPDQKIEQLDINEKDLEVMLGNLGGMDPQAMMQDPNMAAFLRNAAADQFKSDDNDGVRVRTVKANNQAALDREKYKGTGRNDPCPCGSGKKFKQCHGK
jgi:preprotein translocase subunit SecA